MRLPLALLLACFCSAARAQHAAHDHGVAELRVALEGRMLQVEYASPLDTLVGFEHAPSDERQHRLLAEAEATLRNAGRLFRLPAAAGCGLKTVELSSPWALARQEPAAEVEHDHSHAAGGHAEMEVAYTFECGRPQALDTLEVLVFDAFPRTREVRAERVSERGQAAQVLNPQRRQLPL
ncbi:DUF2796 domain-containing protein [Azoarcus sp. TTM-91]|uniref:DUF2796 domain-containing protein n=1 Tax=Azoarcus sp. TTM-91 TaxID=2691581 RepID=UPI00145E0475|nr:DUF2796 domain-containing protein [Azoarcus sp. TTM-91]NMG34400.1 DUF2796 domain-containing protein [Azoarcus sp. TTM-91]